MSYEFEIRDLEPVKAATMRFKGECTDASKYFPKVFKAIKGKSCGAPFCLYNAIDENTGIGDVEVCVPTEEMPNVPGIEVKEIPRINVICTTHVGGYDAVINAYKAVNEYLNKNNMHGTFPYRETYIKGPGMFFKGNPKNYVTEVAVTLVKQTKGE